MVSNAFRRGLPGICLSLTLVGCAGVPMPDVSRFLEPELAVTDGPVEPGFADDPNACSSRDITPAVVETVTEQVLVQPPEIASDGTVVRPAAYRTVTEARIVKERREIWFESVCAKDQTPQFIASLQRALAARGLYAGDITGEMDQTTRRAVRRFQQPEGLHSGVLSIAAAKRLGLAVYRRDEALAQARR